MPVPGAKTVRTPPLGGKTERSHSLSLESPKNYICGVCSDAIDSGASLQCGGSCGNWMHAVCCGLPKALPKCLQDNKFVYFFCERCTPSKTIPASSLGVVAQEDVITTHESVKLSNRFAVLEEKVLAQDRKLDLILDTIVHNAADDGDRSAIDSAEQQYGSAQSYAQAAKGNSSSSSRLPSKMFFSNSAEITRNAVKESFEEEKRLRSAVIEKLPESDPKDPHADFQKVRDIFIELKVDASTITDVHRMPRFLTDRHARNAKPRPLKVVLQDAFSQRILLASASNLKDSTEHRSVFIRRSMPKEERQVLRDLRHRCYMINVAENPDFESSRRDDQAAADPRLHYYNVRYGKIIRNRRADCSANYKPDRGWVDDENWRELAVAHRDEAIEARKKARQSKEPTGYGKPPVAGNV